MAKKTTAIIITYQLNGEFSKSSAPPDEKLVRRLLHKAGYIDIGCTLGKNEEVFLHPHDIVGISVIMENE